MRNALTIDLEDYYHVSAFNDRISGDLWDAQVSRVERNTDLLLELFAAAACKATFFTLGWVAEKYPQVVRQVASGGHEIACHSYRHRTVYRMTPQEFREDTSHAKKLLEDCSGSPVTGYRAPSFSLNRETNWAFEILSELGFAYDSSIFPVRHPNYGVPDAGRSPYRIQTRNGSLVEFPMSTLSLGGMRSPFGGGAYFRILPYWYTRWGIRFLNVNERRPACIYLHPWELDAEQPRMSGNLTSRVRHYLGLKNTGAKLRSLLKDFEFCPLGELVAKI